MTANVLILSPGNDIHALAVQRRVSQLYGTAARATIFDTATFPIASTIHWEFNHDSTVACRIGTPLPEFVGPFAGQALASRTCADLEEIDVRSVTGVWWRRARRSFVHPDVTEPDFRSFCALTADECLNAFLSSCRVYNPVARETEAWRKPYQLCVARRAGLLIPRTLITNDRQRAEAFTERMRGEARDVIYKHAGTATQVGMPARRMLPADEARMNSICYAHVIFQEQIHGGVDLRIAVLGNRVFTCEWRGEHLNPRVTDIRMDEDARMWPGDCPAGLHQPLLKFHEQMGLTFGVYDFKLDSNGTPYFLEVNPSGQWLDMETEAGHPISEAWARQLVEGTGAIESPVLRPFTLTELGELRNETRDIPADWRTLP